MNPWFVCFLSEGLTQHQDESKNPLLRSALHGRRTLIKHGSVEADSQPQAKKKKIDLIFKDVLEASLETSQSKNKPINSTLSTPRTQLINANNHSSSLLHKVVDATLSQTEATIPLLSSGLASVKDLEGSLERHVKVEDTHEEPTTINEGPSTSFCPNCVRLKRRIRELEAELRHFKQQELAETVCLPPSESLPSDDLKGRFIYNWSLNKIGEPFALLAHVFFFIVN